MDENFGEIPEDCLEQEIIEDISMEEAEIPGINWELDLIEDLRISETELDVDEKHVEAEERLEKKL